MPKIAPRPASIPDRAWELRSHYYPYKSIYIDGKRMECIGYPFPNNSSVGLMVRQPGDPTTLTEITLETYGDNQEGNAARISDGRGDRAGG